MNETLFISAFAAELLNMLPYRILSYYPLRRQLRFSLKTVALIMGLTQFIQCAIFAYLTVQGYSVRSTDFIFAASCFLIYFLCISADPWKLLFLYIFNFDYVTLVRGLGIFTESVLFRSPTLTFTTLRSALIIFFYFLVTAPFMLIFLRKTQDRVFQTDSPLFWKTVWLMPAFTTAIVLMFTYSLSPEYTAQLRFLLARLLLLLGIFVVYYTLLHALDGIRRQAALEEQTAQQEALLSLQRAQYQQLTKHISEVIQARHDLRQHLRIIRTYLKDQRTDQLAEYITQYEQSLPPDIELTVCKNFAVNTIVCYFREEARKAGIDFSIYLNLPERLAVNEADFCSAVGNLLENALHACRKVTDTKPFIRLRAEEDSGRIALVVDNSCSQPIQRQDGRIRSTSHEGPGIGTASICAVAERYGGTARFQYENGTFYASVLLFSNRQSQSSEDSFSAEKAPH